MVNGLFRSLLALVLVSVMVGCGGGDDGANDLSAVGESCAKTPDCESGLACVGQVCQLEGADCPADKDCEGLFCGTDPICGQSCGGCSDGKVCEEGLCIDEGCVPDCGGLECGLDPVCGASCGTCGDGKVCEEGLCIDEACVPDCGGLECGLDPVCGASCGTCGDGKTCQAGQCKAGDVAGAPKWISIPGGTFEMGCSPNDQHGQTDERLVHPVTISAFEMLETEVTEAQYEAQIGENPSCNYGGGGGVDNPVECVNWSEAKAYCEAIGGRLPTEAEWEYAARGGTTTRYYCGDEASCLGGIAWYAKNSYDKKHPVGVKTANGYGLYDMLGNVEEWTSDWYGDYSAGAQTNPQGPNGGSERVFRGGSFFEIDGSLTVSRRNHVYPSYASGYLGARCARSK